MGQRAGCLERELIDHLKSYFNTNGTVSWYNSSHSTTSHGRCAVSGYTPSSPTSCGTSGDLRTVFAGVSPDELLQYGNCSNQCVEWVSYTPPALLQCGQAGTDHAPPTDTTRATYSRRSRLEPLLLADQLSRRVVAGRQHHMRALLLLSWQQLTSRTGGLNMCARARVER
ncbi:hypothetical protein PR048_005486 [Dryococelus australis]|uniref:Uncharacterized protein n=1 Tax=Dryococelus australis TaxID=614101 RepID=A0ABQ9I8A5_9NEOP|nr:hypothetical protein PR048_005486 [Dryococelus australis]